MSWNTSLPNVTGITPFKVIQGHRIWYQSIAHMRLPRCANTDVLTGCANMNFLHEGIGKLSYLLTVWLTVWQMSLYLKTTVRSPH